METFGSNLGYCDQVECDDVAINQENYRLVTHSASDNKLEVYKLDNSLLRAIHVFDPFGVCLAQSGAIFIAEWGANKVLKYC